LPHLPRELRYGISIDYRSEYRKIVCELKDDIKAIKEVLTPGFEKTPIITPQKRTTHQRDAFEDTSFKPGFQIVMF
jgi:hypothetical protein